MSKKYCKKCCSCHVKKDGFMRNKQRYKCCVCGHVFQHTSRINKKAHKKLWEDYALRKQTYEELAVREQCSVRTIQTHLDAYEPGYEHHWTTFRIEPPETMGTSIILLMDTTYFGREFGVMVFRSATTKTILCTMIVHHETVNQYTDVIQKIQEAGWHIAAIVCDGKRGLLGWCMRLDTITQIPTQMCQFHQGAIVLRATTKKPKTEANRELKQLAHLLTRTDKETFTYELEHYELRWGDYLKQRTRIETGKHAGRYTYTHRKTRSAFFSLKRNLQYLFTWYDYYGQLSIPNTTNWLEGAFGHLKAKVSLHRWLKRSRKLKLILTLLYSKNPSSQPHTFCY